MKHIIVGASSGLGRELAFKFAKEKKNLILISRDERDLLAIKSDLQIRFGVNIECIALDFSSINEINQKFLSKVEILKDIKVIMFPVGLMFDSDNLNTPQENLEKLIFANFLSVSYTINKLSKHLESNNSSIIGFGSVSGLVGRNLNPNYAAAKRGLESYFESLAFEKKFKNTNIQFYILGYLDTNLAFGKKLLLPKGSIRKLALVVFRNRNKKYKKTFYPFFWNLIGFTIKILPFSILVKLYKLFN